MENKTENQKKFEHIQDVISTINLNTLDDSLIKDNKLHFNFEGKSYRVRMPSQKEISDAHRKKDAFQCELVSSKTKIHTKETLKALLKENQGIDIDALEAKRKDFQDKLQDVYLDLALIHPDSEGRIDEQKEIIRGLEAEFTKLFMEITRWLEPSLENQLEKVFIEYLTSKCCDVENIVPEKDSTWSPVWASYESFLSDSSNLTSECIKNMTFLLVKTNR